MAKAHSIRVRYTLRALFVFITLFMLWGGYHTNRSWKERAAEQVLREQGASFGYGPKLSGSGLLNYLSFAYQKVVQTVWRERFVTRVSMVSLVEPEVIDALQALPNLESISAQPGLPNEEEQKQLRLYHFVEAKVAIPDGVLDRILGDRPLRGLSLDSWILSDADCRAIARCTTLEHLNISGSKVSESGFAQLLTLPKLESLGFSYCQVTGEQLASVPGIPTLERIECRYAPVGNEFAAFVGRSPGITVLRLWTETADDDFVAQLGRHPSLYELSLGSSKLTDNSAVALKPLPSLKYLTLGSANVSERARASLGQLGVKVQ